MLTDTVDQLIMLEPEKWYQLRDKFKDNWPLNIVAYSTIDNFCKWNKKSDIPYVNFYCLNGDFSDGTVLIKVFVA